MLTESLPITAPVFEHAVRAAVRAPSMYNSQPWRFRLHDDGMEIYADPAVRLPVADESGWAARVALGAAAANAQLALAVAGLVTQTSVRVADVPERVMIRAVGQRQASPAEKRLYQAIPRRRSHRTPFWTTAVPADARARMAEVALRARCWLEFAPDREAVVRIAEIVAEADRALRADPSYEVEMRRWTGRADSDVIGISQSAAGTVPEGQDLLRLRDYGGTARAAGRDFEHEPLLAVLGALGGGRPDDITAGMGLQLVLLSATADGLSTSMLSQPIEASAARAELGRALAHHGWPHMLIRVGYGPPGPPSLRRPIEEVIDPVNANANGGHRD